MYKNSITIFLLFFSLFSFGQEKKRDSIVQFEKSFQQLSYNDFEYSVDYMEDKKTLYFKSIKSGIPVNGYKLLVEDIHPKGIYLYKSNGRYTIRVISLNNGNVFIKENFGGKYRNSNTTNYVDIGAWGESNKPNIVEFILNFQKFVTERKATEDHSPDDDEIIIVTDEKN